MFWRLCEDCCILQYIDSFISAQSPKTIVTAGATCSVDADFVTIQHLTTIKPSTICDIVGTNSIQSRVCIKSNSDAAWIYPVKFIKLAIFDIY